MTGMKLNKTVDDVKYNEYPLTLKDNKYTVSFTKVSVLTNMVWSPTVSATVIKLIMLKSQTS